MCKTPGRIFFIFSLILIRLEHVEKRCSKISEIQTFLWRWKKKMSEKVGQIETGDPVSIVFEWLLSYVCFVCEEKRCFERVRNVIFALLIITGNYVGVGAQWECISMLTTMKTSAAGDEREAGRRIGMRKTRKVGEKGKNVGTDVNSVWRVENKQRE